MTIPVETGRFAGEHVTKLLDRLAFKISSARHSHGAEAVHDLRVAIRRLNQALIVFKPCFNSKEVKKTHLRLKNMMVLAGRVRDCDIALKYLSESHAPEVAALKPQFEARRKEAETALVGDLNRWVMRRSFSKWRSRLETAPDSSGFSHRRVDDMARQILPRLAKGFFKSGNRAAESKATADELHQFRIAAKKFRYTIELFASFYEPAADEWLVRITNLQSLLGRVNDCRTVRAMVSRMGENPKIEASLKRRQQGKTHEFRRLWAEAEEFCSSWVTARQWMHASRNSRRKPVDRSTWTVPRTPRAAR